MAYEDVLAVILGGGRGTRLWPLTKFRAKPAVPIAGKYRLIDIPVSNCLNSGIHQISILTQFNSVSLHRHIARTYNFDSFHPGWVQVLAAVQTFTSEDWYQGTADAVRKQLFEIEVTGARDVLILAGDHLYRMDYAHLLDVHRAEQADVTVAVQPVAAEDAERFGILKLGTDGRIRSFVEKPQTPQALQGFVSRDDLKTVRRFDGNLHLPGRGAVRADGRSVHRLRRRRDPGCHPIASRVRLSLRRLLGGHRDDPGVL
jgi:glucose-1-phosphate adenylyltransferase